MTKTPELPERLRWRDYFQLFTTGLMVVLGLYILWQTILAGWAFPPLILGAAFLVFGLFRVRMIRAYFLKRGRRDGV